MAYADDIELLRTWADPRIPRDEKMALLNMGPGPGLPANAIAQADVGSGGAVSDARNAVPGFEGGGAPAFRRSAPGPTSVANPTEVPGGLPPTNRELDRDPQISPVTRHQIIEGRLELERKLAERKAAEAAAAGPKKVDIKSPADIVRQISGPAGETEEGGAGLAADDPRLALMAWQSAQGGAAPKPTEKVEQQLQIQRGGLTPEAASEYMAAREEADAAAMGLAQQQASLEQQQQAAMMRAAEAAQQERDDLERIRTIGQQRTQDLVQNMDRVSREIAQMDPVEPSLYAGKSFGESLMTGLSLLAFGLGAGATRTTGEIMPFAKMLANREVDKQAALIAAKRGQIDAFGSILERHMANLKDVELAKKASIADILGIGELTSMRLAQQSSEPMTKQKLQQQAAALKAARLQEMAALQKELGDKVLEQTSLAYMRERNTANQLMQTRAPATAAPASATQSAAPPTERAPDSEFMTGPVTGEELDAIQAPSSATAPAKVSTNRVGAVQKNGQPEAAPVAGKPKDAKEATIAAVNAGAKLWQTGRHAEALHSLPPTIKKAVEAQASRILKGKSLGEGATPEEAKAWALSSLLGWTVPKKMILSGSRDRMVTLPDGRYGFVAAPNQTQKRQEEFNSDAALIGAYNKLLTIANRAGAKLSPDDLTEIKTLSELIRPNLNVSLGGGAMAEFENELLKGPSGGDINSVQGWVLGTGKKAAQTALELVRGRLRARLSGVSKSPFDVEPISASGGVK